MYGYVCGLGCVCESRSTGKDGWARVLLVSMCPAGWKGASQSVVAHACVIAPCKHVQLQAAYLRCDTCAGYCMYSLVNLLPACLLHASSLSPG
jgi:hypothetical protein